MSETLCSLVESAKYAPSLKNDITAYFHIAILSRSIGETKTYEKFAKKLEKAFRDVPEIKGCKQIGSLVFKPNGVLEETKEYQCIVLNEWTSSYKPKTRKKQKSYCFTMREFANFNGYFPGDILINKYSSSLNYLDKSIGNYWTQKREWKKNVEIIAEKLNDFMGNRTISISYPKAIKSVLMYKNIKDEQNVNLLNLLVNDKNYKLVLFAIAKTLLNQFSWNYASHDSIVYFSENTANKIKAEINKKRSVYNMEEVSLSIIEKVISKEYPVEKIEIPEISLIVGIIEKICEKKSSRNNNRFCQIYLNGEYHCLSENDLLDESKNDLFEELWNLLYSSYNFMYEKSANDTFLTWLFTEQMAFIESNPNP